jgi:antitoxin CptB
MACVTDISAARRKRLLWRATHRGIKEMDLLLGGYVAVHLATLSEADLDALETIIDIPDQTLLAWATRLEDVPANAPPLLRAILNHRP